MFHLTNVGNAKEMPFGMHECMYVYMGVCAYVPARDIQCIFREFSRLVPHRKSPESSFY